MVCGRQSQWSCGDIRGHILFTGRVRSGAKARAALVTWVWGRCGRGSTTVLKVENLFREMPREMGQRAGSWLTPSSGQKEGGPRGDRETGRGTNFKSKRGMGGSGGAKRTLWHFQ